MHSFCSNHRELMQLFDASPRSFIRACHGREYAGAFAPSIFLIIRGLVSQLRATTFPVWCRTHIQYDRSSCPRGGSQRCNSSEVACISRRSRTSSIYICPTLDRIWEGRSGPSIFSSDAQQLSQFTSFSRSRFHELVCIVVMHACNDGPAPRFWLGIF